MALLRKLWGIRLGLGLQFTPIHTFFLAHAGAESSQSPTRLIARAKQDRPPFIYIPTASTLNLLLASTTPPSSSSIKLSLTCLAAPRHQKPTGKKLRRWEPGPMIPDEITFPHPKDSLIGIIYYVPPTPSVSVHV